MPHPEQPSYEELSAGNAELAAGNAELAAGNAELTARVAELTAVVAELTAVVAEQAALIESLRAEVAALRRQGGRKGHPGAGLQRAARPDETRVIEPGFCGRCGADLAGAAGSPPECRSSISRRPR